MLLDTSRNEKKVKLFHGKMTVSITIGKAEDWMEAGIEQRNTFSGW